MSDVTRTGNPFFDAWMDAGRRFLEPVGQSKPMTPMIGGAGMSDAVARAQETWELCQRQTADWVKASSRFLASGSPSDGGDGIAEETLRKMMDPTRFLYAGTDEINHAIQRLVEGPEFADIGTIERQVLKATREWMALREASAAYRGVTSAAWSRAFQTFSKETAKDPGLLQQGFRAVLDRWLGIANDELIRTQRTDEFLKAQRELLAAGVAYRLKERELVEVWCETHSIPTRTEVDDLHRTVHELRRQVRALNARLAATDTRPDATATPAETARARTPSRHPGPSSGCSPQVLRSDAMPEQTFRPDQSWREAVEFGARFARGAEALGRIRDVDVDVGATPKTETMRVEKVTLHRYDPLPGVEVKTGPVLIVYGLVGRYTMADLQEDRSLVRNLLKRGVDLWVVDWGHPSRADQFLSIDNYVDWFLDDCIEHIRKASGVDGVTLLGICEGGTFSTLYAARHGEKVKNLILTITPIDFHADQQHGDASHGFINLWTRNLTDDDITKLIDAFGNLPGEIMASVFQLMSPVRDHDQIQPRPPGRRRGRQETHELPAHGEVACRSPAPSRRCRQAMADRSLQGEPAGQGYLRARRGNRGPQAGHHAGAECLRAAGYHHPAAVLDGARTAGRDQRLHGAAAARRACRRLRQLEEPGHRW